MKRNSPNTAERLTAELDALTRLDRNELSTRWQSFYGAPPPARFSRPLMIRAIAYKMQERTLGGLKASTQRQLSESSIGSASAISHRPSAGTMLVREWRGQSHQVTVLETSFLYQKQRYRSLSEIARQITGVRWSGPRFFGLKSHAAA